MPSTVAPRPDHQELRRFPCQPAADGAIRGSRVVPRRPPEDRYPRPLDRLAPAEGRVVVAASGPFRQDLVAVNRAGSDLVEGRVALVGLHGRREQGPTAVAIYRAHTTGRIP